MGAATAIALAGLAVSAWSASEQQKVALAADDRTENAKRRQDEMIAEAQQKKKNLEAQKAQEILSRQTLAMRGASAPTPASPLGSASAGASRLIGE